jgi:hypothetical protein
VTAPGQPTKYRKEYAARAEALCEMGATDQELADFFVVDVRTIYNWKHTHPAFFQALRVGKEACDDRVERSLYQRAIGYEQEAVKIFMPAGAEQPVYAPYRERIAADVGAAKLWLTNRRGEAWREKTETDIKVAGDLADIIAHRRAKVAEGK